MSERNVNQFQQPNGAGDPPVPAEARTPRHGFWWKVWQVLQVVQARLRFIVLLVLLGVVFSSWGTLSNYWEKWTRVASAEPAASPDVEYFCPMHPTVIRDHPGEKCPICHMDLARRKKGTGQGEPLPAGTVSRVQLTPYRQVLAGVQTAEVRYQELAKDITTFGTIEFDETKQAHIAATQKGRIVKQYVNFTGQTVDKGEKLAVLDVRYSTDLTNTLDDLLRARQSGNRELERMARQRLRVWDLSDEQVEEFLRTGKVNTQLTIYSPIKGHVIKKFQREGEFVDEGMSLYDVADLETVWVEAQVYEADQPLIHEGQKVVATTLARPNEGFEGVVSFIYPHLDEATRTLTVRMELPSYGHRLRPGDYATVKVHVPPRAIAAFSQALAEEWAKGSAVDALAHALGAPGGPPPAPWLRPTLDAAAGQAQLQRGLVLAVPDSAVIDTGSLKVVYRLDEAAPDTFEGVAVQLGPRLAEPGTTTAFYPVLRGLHAGDRVVTNGAFLVDADTRLNPAAGSVYYGGSGSSGGQGAVAVRPSTPEDEDARERKARSALAKLNADDRKLAEAQKTCPVRGTRLGSMGVPVKVVLDGQPVFLCCGGCEDEAKADPRKTLARVEEVKAKRTSSPAPAPEAAAVTAEDATIRTNLAKLAAEDRALAEEQKFCPVQQDTRLGEMGVPVKLTLQGQTVFVCCKSCKKEAESEPAKTLAKVMELRHRHE